MTNVEMCHCGRPLHYTDPSAKQLVDLLVRDKGRFIYIKFKGKAYEVDRHYIALHGLKSEELPGLGFKELEIDNATS